MLSYMCRLHAEKKSTKKHVDATKAWQKQHKEKVRAAERHTAQYDASDLPIPSALDADQLEVEENHPEETDAEELQVHEPVFFPQQVETHTYLVYCRGIVGSGAMIFMQVCDAGPGS